MSEHFANNKSILSFKVTVNEIVLETSSRQVQPLDWSYIVRLQQDFEISRDKSSNICHNMAINTDLYAKLLDIYLLNLALWKVQLGGDLQIKYNRYDTIKAGITCSFVLLPFIWIFFSSLNESDHILTPCVWLPSI